MKTPRVADFYPDAKPVPSLGSPMDHLPAIQKQTHSQEPIQQSQEKRTLDRTYARTPVRRFRRRYPFEFFKINLTGYMIILSKKNNKDFQEVKAKW